MIRCGVEGLIRCGDVDHLSKTSCKQKRSEEELASHHVCFRWRVGLACVFGVTYTSSEHAMLERQGGETSDVASSRIRSTKSKSSKVENYNDVRSVLPQSTPELRKCRDAFVKDAQIVMFR